jgi:TRAP-type C4-dicarboxylate transport system permease small subunit
MSGPGPDADKGDEHLIVVEEQEIRNEFYPEDIVSFILFWAMGGIVFLQFFTRYVLNDSVAWTEEIARYLLMWVTFVGAAVAMRRRVHIAVEVLLNFMPPRVVRILNFLIDAITLGFTSLLCWYAVTIYERMKIQKMTVIDWPMSYVYAGVGLGCFLLLYRTVQMVFSNARRGWRPDPARQGLIID